MKKRQLSFWEIWNVSFGFMGVQFGFALQNANISNVLENLGADVHSLSFFWLAAPVMGLIVQPIVGGASDLTWNKRFGRRGPFILGGAFFAALGMYLMPNSPLFVKLMPAMFFGGLMLALMDGSFNVTMQPFRALVADMLPESQRNKGYSIQSLLINIGAVIGSALPFILTNVIGLSNIAEKGQVSASVTWAFYIGATILLGSVLWTVFKTKEYPPEVYYANEGIDPEEIKAQREADAKRSFSQKASGFIGLVVNMPKTMKQLAVVQFFSWFALFLMWVYTTPAIGQYIWDVPQYLYGDISKIPGDVPISTIENFRAAKGAAGDWVGILFAGYSLFAAIFSVVMIKIANTFGRKPTYAVSLLLGGLSYVAFLLFKDPEIIQVNLLIASFEVPKGAVMLIIPMIGVGIAWAAILAMPYAILSNALPPQKMGIYMGIFNFTIAGPQIIAGLFGSFILKLLGEKPIYMIVVAGVSMLLAAAFVFIVKETIPKPINETSEE
ncbi:SLC45 family MFS transporter [Paucihalobacter ruber]|jgi:maltose/moltooligosaccharide transporter|uniref:SLC45 family MFS transporter n=1 Tax=Paucihalobacter ruber TaxID=2567861 RepID=A0A506PHK5_9FLAO|nr:MFS transporter [Paucihalobacter ruber]TPV31850.1 SLC45 family MFS transporter [Paucihalobacter ruber]